MTVNPFSELADVREAEARQYSIEEIMKATARNALASQGTKPLEKVSLALATIPEADPIKADAFVRNLIDEMVDGGLGAYHLLNEVSRSLPFSLLKSPSPWDF
ncbi:MAG: hypothetical protein ACE5OZ_15300 [Candidatus Heimdallarchaeota archaeon]